MFTIISHLNSWYFFLRISSKTITASLTKILNISLKTGIFPDTFHEATVTPSFKKDDFQESNYRPNSILPILLKYWKISEWSSPKILCETQFPIWTDSLVSETTISALTPVIDGWFSAINNTEIVHTVLPDLFKAFDLVNHGILLYKLNDISVKAAWWGLNHIFINANSRFICLGKTI